MSAIRTVLAEIFGLFVDDAGFAVSILAWVAAVWLLLPRPAIPSAWSAIILFVGLATILLVSAWRRARR